MKPDIVASSSAPRFQKPHAMLAIGECLDLTAIQGHFNDTPVDSYVSEGFRSKSICRMRVHDQSASMSPHGPLYQPRAFNPVHGGIVRHYPAMDARLSGLLGPLVQIFAACARLRFEHEILVQAQRISANSGLDGATGFPVVEGWHQDNTVVLGIFLVNKVNIDGGISLLAADGQGSDLVFARSLAIGDLLLVDDTSRWHNTTPITKCRPESPAYRDVVILTWPSCRAEDSMDSMATNVFAAEPPARAVG
jgi:hypothetical protein